MYLECMLANVICYWPSGLPSRNSFYDGFGDWEIQEYGACYWVSAKGPLFSFEDNCLFTEYSWITDRDIMCRYAFMCQLHCFFSYSHWNH